MTAAEKVLLDALALMTALQPFVDPISDDPVKQVFIEAWNLARHRALLAAQAYLHAGEQ